MSAYNRLRRRLTNRWLLIVAGVVLLSVLAIVGLRLQYHRDLQPASASQRSQLVTIPLNSSVRAIAKQLKQAGLIRSQWAFETYVRSQEVTDELQAGTYDLRSSQSVPAIVAILTQGKVKTDLITILPGQRLDQIRQMLINTGFRVADVDAALKPQAYSNHPALVDLPPGTPNLEGYLYPDSWRRDSQTRPQDIIKQSLDAMQQHLTPDIRAGFAAQGLTVHQGVILASIVEQEVSKPADRAQVAQVFLTRLSRGMALESDTTAYYGAIVANQTPSLSYDSPYNTRLHPGLPAGPISNVSQTSLQAVAHPADTDYLYFVSGDDGITYFSHTIEEHQALTAQHCKKLCNGQ